MNKATNVILSLFIAMVMFSCGHHTKDKSNAHQIDSLKALCQNYAMELQVDTLRQTASLLLGKTQQHSKEYYQALCFHILADFNAHDFNKVLTRIAMANTSPHFHDYPDVVCRYEYMKARVYQRTQQYDQAINEFKG